MIVKYAYKNGGGVFRRPRLAAFVGVPGYLFLDNFCLKFVLVYIVAARRGKNFLKGGQSCLIRRKLRRRVMLT